MFLNANDKRLTRIYYLHSDISSQPNTGLQFEREYLEVDVL